MSTPDKPRINPKFSDGDEYVYDGGVLTRDPFGRWYAGINPLPGFPQYTRIWVLSDHHLDDVDQDADGRWRDRVNA